VLTVKTEIALLKPQIEDAHNQLESAGAELASLLAETGKYELKLKGSLRGLIFQELQKRMHIKEARLPELERVRVAREQLAEMKDTAFGKHLPNLQLLGDYGTNSYTKADFNNSYTRDWSLMLQLTVPLFSGFQSIDERRSFVEQDKEFDFQGRNLENTLALAQVQSLKALQSAGASLVSAEEAAKLSDQSMVEVRRQYRLGTIDFIQFLTVEKNALQAYSSLDTIKYNNIVAYSKYFVATGQPLSILVDTLQENK
jgi:outer membrane protein TolC